MILLSQLIMPLGRERPSPGKKNGYYFLGVLVAVTGIGIALARCTGIADWMSA